MNLSTRPLATTFGAEVSGVDLSRPLDEQAANTLRELWHRHALLLFRGQTIDEKQLVAFSRNFGALEIHLRREYLSPENPEVLYVSNVKKDGRPIGILSDTEVGWHYDQIYLPRPAVGSLLYSVIIPADRGATSFADMTAAYEALPDATKQRLEGRKAVQSYEAFNRSYSVPTSEEQRKKSPDIEQPIVRTHPYSGRKALYICPGMTTRIAGFAEQESATLLAELFAWTVQPRFVYTHAWQLGDALLWDNACTMHRREPFDGTQQRLMKRTTILPDAAMAEPF
ncbi:MAG: TauD/TfdA family dioxygenase [Betaproteobacteria bacterium]|nr:TauD/TfdA family dioxygenase [Betaproteobacteria bacterium]